MSGIGHNKGPTLEKGHRWRSYQWRRAQKALMPNTIPLAIVKMRLRRAAELGMDYKAYASIRQATGRDICGLLFSSNALCIMAGEAAMPAERRAVLASVTGAERLALVHAPISPDAVLRENPLEAAGRAPDLRHRWPEMRAQLCAFAQARKLNGDQVVIVGETALEEEWMGAMRAAGYLPAARYFQSGAQSNGQAVGLTT